MNKKFAFTEKEIKEKCQLFVQDTFSDTLCKGLRLVTFETGMGSYVLYLYSPGSQRVVAKVIGSVYRVSLETARKIANNVKDNYAEFLKTPKQNRRTLFEDFEKNGYYPRKIKGTEVILSDENGSLKQKIKELEGEVSRLQEENIVLKSRLDTIRNLVTVE